MLSLPFIPFFKIEISDAPAFAATILFGMSSGIIIIFIVSFLRTFFFSIAGWPGFGMRLASIIVVIILSLYVKFKKKFLGLFLILGIFFYILIKIPFSYFFWVFFFNIPSLAINNMMPAIIFYNLTRIIINYIICFYILNLINRAGENFQ